MECDRQEPPYLCLKTYSLQTADRVYNGEDLRDVLGQLSGVPSTPGDRFDSGRIAVTLQVESKS